MSSPARRPRRYRTRAILALLSAFIVLPIGWVAVDLWRVHQDMPASVDPHRAAMLELCVDGQPEGENGWPQLAGVLTRFASEADVVRRTVPDADTWEATNEALLNGLDGMLDDARFVADLRRALEMPRHARPWTTTGMPFNELLPLIRPAQTLGDLLARRAGMAADVGDWPQAVDMVGLALRLGAVTARQPTTIHALRGFAIQTSALQAARSMILDHPVPVGVAEELISLVAGVQDPSVERHIEVERESTQSVLHWTHGSRGYALPLTTLFEVDVLSEGLIAMEPIDLPNDPRSLSRAILARWVLATRAECGRLADRWYDALQDQATRPFAARWDDWPPPALDAAIDQPRNAMLTTFLPRLSGLVDQADGVILHRNATLVVAALHRYAAEHGGRPPSLAYLVPGSIPALPPDPISGVAWGYRVQPDDAAGPGFVLYSVGTDATDDGGRFEPDAGASPRYRTPHGFDIPLH